MMRLITENDKKHERQMTAIREIELSLERIRVAIDCLKEIRHDIKEHDRKIIRLESRLKSREATNI